MVDNKSLAYKFEESQYQERLEGRYWNCQGINIAIVAVVTKGIDWAAYIGADTDSTSELKALEYVVNWGSKMDEKDARYFFPNIELPYRR